VQTSEKKDVLSYLLCLLI